MACNEWPEHRFPTAGSVFTLEAVVVEHDFPDRVADLRIRRNRTIALHASFAGIVRRHRHPHILVTPIQHISQVPRPTANIAPGIIYIPNTASAVDQINQAE